MKYMINMFGSEAEMLETRSRDWIREMIEFMHSHNQDLRAAGEYVDAQGLVDPSQSKTIRFDGEAPAVTDGPYAEAKESLAGYWIVDVENEERAVEIATRVVAFTHGPIEVRQIGEAPEV